MGLAIISVYAIIKVVMAVCIAIICVWSVYTIIKNN